MSTVLNLDGDANIRGSLVVTTLAIPSGTVVNDDVNAAAAIATSKMLHHHTRTVAIESDTSNTDQAWPVHLVHGATGTLISFECGQIVTANGSSCNMDVLLNGVSVLSAAVTVGTAAGTTIVAGTLSTTAITDGDVLQISFDQSTSGTAGKGAFGTLTWDETYT